MSNLVQFLILFIGMLIWVEVVISCLLPKMGTMAFAIGRVFLPIIVVVCRICIGKGSYTLHPAFPPE